MNYNRNSWRQTPVEQRPVLRLGSSGTWVSELQRDLQRLTYYNGPINGNFDAATDTAVRSFQRVNNLVVDGIVGRLTWSSLINLYSPLPICGPTGHMPVPFEGLVIDPGHGGTDPGAIAGGILEKDMNLDISMYQKDRFNELNVPVFLTRESDISLSPTERVNRVRNAFGNGRGVVCISNHNNAGGGEGAEVIYALRNTNLYPNMLLNEIKLAGQVIRRAFQRPSETNPNQDFFFILRDTANIQTVIVEYAFLDNPRDVSRLRDNWRLYAEAVVKATCEYIGYPYTPPYASEFVYTVTPGDTLFSIANRFNTTVDLIMEINNLTGANIFVGQRLRIPTTTPRETFTYTVVAGDTLFSIANRFNTTVTELRTINNLTSDVISIGQQLQIPQKEEIVLPPPPPPTVRPTLREGSRGDAVVELQMMLISLGYNPGSTSGIFGPLTNTAVRSFQRDNGLVVDGIVGPITWAALDRLTTEQEETFTYTVMPGDTLFSIANRFNTTVNELRSINSLTSDVISIGQQLQIPGSTSGQITYTVTSGDTLFSISRRFNTTVDAIMALNRLTSTTLNIGQQLLIPS